MGMSESSFFSSMIGYAESASFKTGIPKEVILAQWALESNYGQSDLAKRANNFAGIKWNRSADYMSGAYAGYFSVSDFVSDYSRVMGLSYYDGVRNAGSIEGAIKALGESPYAEDKNYAKKVSDVVNKLFNMGITPAKDNPLENMDKRDLILYGALAFVGLLFIFE